MPQKNTTSEPPAPQALPVAERDIEMLDRLARDYAAAARAVRKGDADALIELYPKLRAAQRDAGRAVYAIRSAYGKLKRGAEP